MAKANESLERARQAEASLKDDRDHSDAALAQAVTAAEATEHDLNDAYIAAKSRHEQAVADVQGLKQKREKTLRTFLHQLELLQGTVETTEQSLRDCTAKATAQETLVAGLEAQLGKIDDRLMEESRATQQGTQQGPRPVEKPVTPETVLPKFERHPDSGQSRDRLTEVLNVLEEPGFTCSCATLELLGRRLAGHPSILSDAVEPTGGLADATSEWLAYSGAMAVQNGWDRASLAWYSWLRTVPAPDVARERALDLLLSGAYHAARCDDQRIVQLLSHRLLEVWAGVPPPADDATEM
jgi:hypothetical protein